MQTNGENLTKEDDIEYYFSVNLKMLSVTGLKCSLNNKLNRNYKISDKLLTYFFNFLGIILAATQIYYLVDVFSYDTPMTMKIFTQLISNSQCISKGFRMANAIEQLQKLFEELGIIWKKYRPNNEIRLQILNEAYGTFFFSYCYIIASYATVVFYDIPPLRNYAQQYLAREETNHTYDYTLMIVLAKYPFEIKNAATYFSLLLEQEILLIMSGIYWVNSDTIFAQLTTHISLQFKILKHDIEKLIDHEKINDNLRKNIIMFVRRHRELLSLCELIEQVFSPVIFSTMVLSAINICINVFEIRETIAKGSYEESGIYIFLSIVTFFQIVFYCVFAERLTEQTSSIADSIYNCKWTQKDYKIRFYLQLIILRAQCPFYCSAYKFFPIGHKRLTLIINTSFSYYMMLQTMGS